MGEALPVKVAHRWVAGGTVTAETAAARSHPVRKVRALTLLVELGRHIVDTPFVEPSHIGSESPLSRSSYAPYFWVGSFLNDLALDQACYFDRTRRQRSRARLRAAMNDGNHGRSPGSASEAAIPSAMFLASR